MQCLKALRAIEAGAPLPEKHSNYTPVSKEKPTLLNRDPNLIYGDQPPADPYKQGLEDCVIITMKGISAGMQNTG